MGGQWARAHLLSISFNTKSRFLSMASKTLHGEALADFSKLAYCTSIHTPVQGHHQPMSHLRMNEKKVPLWVVTALWLWLWLAERRLSVN